MKQMKKAKSLFSPKRLDFVVKYLYAKEILEKQERNDYQTDVYKDLYIRHILMRTLGVEPKDCYGASSEKQNADDYINSYKNLIIDIRENGFKKEFPIPFNQEEGLCGNGAHRLAACAALDKEVYIQNIRDGLSWDFNWFKQKGFNTEDLQRILKGFVDINAEHCSVFVVWNPLFKCFENVKSVICNYFDIVGEVELDFENNYIAFTNALLEIYEPNIAQANGDNKVILEKSKLLQSSYLSFKVIVVYNRDKNITELSKKCKDDIRNLFNHLLPKECFCTVHSADNCEEAVYLSNILLSPNNIKHLKMRLDSQERPNFNKRIRKLKNFLSTIGIESVNDVCVIGSGVMTALGIQSDSDSDSDFIIDHKYRDALGHETVFLNDDYDIGVSSKVVYRKVSDNTVIHNNEWHFYYKGVKFANLELIKERKRLSAREKDIIHLREIDLFEKMLGNINQQKLLMERVEAERQRRLGLNGNAL